jgi:hypothetical protein
MLLRKTVSGLMLALMLISTLTLAFNIRLVKSSNPEVLSISSDTTTEWWNGTAWNPSVACWVSPTWPSIEGALWIWNSYLVDSEALFGPITFRKLFILPDNAININGTISITADNAYELYFNDEFIGKDGYVSSPPITHEEDPQNVERWETIETYNIKPKPGLNEIRIIAVNYRGWVDPYTNPAGVIYRADIFYELLPIIEATLNISPNTLNLENKGKWITAYIELPEGYSVADINRTTILLNGTISVDPFWISKPIKSVIGDYDNDSIPDLMVKFNRQQVINYIMANVDLERLYEVRFMTITLTVTGKLNNGTPFQGSDTIRIILPMPRYWRLLAKLGMYPF